MKHNFLFFSLFFSIILTAQDSEILLKVNYLREKIELSEKGEKLKLMDSLCSTINYKTSLKYDSIVKATIHYALQLDSISIATNRTADFIYYKNGIVNKPKEGLAIFKQFIEKKLPINNNYFLARLYLNGADSYFFLGDFKSALKNYDIAKKYAKKSENYWLLGLINLYMGYTHSDIGNFPEASIELQNAEKLFQKEKDTFNIIAAKNSLANLYSKNAFYEVAELEREEAIILAKKINGYRNLVSLYYNGAEDFRRVGKLKECIANLLISLEFHEKSNNDFYMRPVIICKLIVAYSEGRDLNSLEKYLQEIEANKILYTNELNNGNYLEVLKYVAFAKGNYQKSLKLAKEHLASKIKDNKPEGIQDAEKFLSKVYKALGNKAEANFHLNNYYAIKDSVSSVQKINGLSYYQTFFETKKRDFKIENQVEHIMLLNEKNKVKNQWLLFGGTGLVSVFGFIMLYRSRNTAKRKQKLQEKFLQNLIEVKENESTRLSRELHDSVGQKLMLLTKKIKLFGITEMDELADSTLNELRNISKGLHPSTIEQLGITSAIIALVNEVDEHTNMFFTNDIENIDENLNKETQLHLYRILQEALNNIVKHAAATTVFVTIVNNASFIKMTIEDNGKGFDFFKIKKENTSLGMKTILERSKIINSKLAIKTKQGEGTVIELIIPKK
ncbi:sensor histidine kinase [Lutibacter citreus]|uniref:sensor histidine kinase n=1 Tax=Lutibacter citreus TaxID=2138210 RepID=UPI000DBE6AC3|nr:sensor histidine kinase [Lutibacter citreus]